MLPGFNGMRFTWSGSEPEPEPVPYVLSWWQRTYEQLIPGDNDLARMGIGFLDSGNSLIGTVTWASLARPTSWIHRSINALAPEGAVKIRIYMEMTRITGTVNDGYIDDITLTLDGESLTVVNPGAESGTTGWTVLIGELIVNGDGKGAGLPHSGSYFFVGGSVAFTLAYQDISI